MSRLYSIYLQYTDKHLSEGVLHLDALENRISPGNKAIRIIIDNFLSENQTINKDDYIIFGGDNTAHEFSGWDRGIELLEEQYQLEKEDVILFANDSYFRNYDPELTNNFSESHLHIARRKKALIGVLDTFPEPMIIDGKERKCWVRSNCFLMSFELVKLINGIQYVRPIGELFSGVVDPFFMPNGNLPEKYQAYLNIWLFREESPLLAWRHHWYKSAPLSIENIDMMRLKAYCIISEHALSWRVSDRGGRLINILPEPRLGFRTRITLFMKRITKKIISTLKF